MFMKQLTKTKAVLAGASLLGLVSLAATLPGFPAWSVAGILGLAAWGFSVTLRQPKLAPVRIRSQKGRN